MSNRFARVPLAGSTSREGRVAVSHALRHAFIANLAHAGVWSKVAQELHRHSTITLTMDRYRNLRPEAEARALDSLPDPSSTAVAKAQAKGTDGTSFLASCLPSEDAADCRSAA